MEIKNQDELETERFPRELVSEILLQSTKAEVRKKSRQLFERDPSTFFEKEETGTILFRLDEITTLIKSTKINECRYWVKEVHRAVLQQIVEEITSRYVLEKNDEIFIGMGGIKIDLRTKVLEAHMQEEIIGMMRGDLQREDEGNDGFNIEERYRERMIKGLLPVARNIAELLQVPHEVLNEIGSRYLILDEAGKGAMGKVYKAFDLRLERLVALKITDFMERKCMDSSERKVRFVREVQGQASLIHPHAATLYTARKGQHQGYETMEWAEGKTLQAIIAEDGSFPLLSERETFGAIDIMIEILETLRALHGQNPPRIHRDIKPSNIILHPKKGIKIFDFGITTHPKKDEVVSFSESFSLDEDPKRTTSDGGRVCSLPYAAPEYLILGGITSAYDIYSAGVVFYELLTGFAPIREETEEGIFQRVTEWFYKKSSSGIFPLTLANKAVPERLEQLIEQKMVTATPEERASASEIILELQIIRAELEKGRKNSSREKETRRVPRLKPPINGAPTERYDDMM